MPTATEADEAEQAPATHPVSLPRQWLDHHGDVLYAYAIRRVRRPEAAEDLLQETLLAAVTAWKDFGGRANVRTWLTGILRHKIADHLRARYRHQRVETQSIEDDELFTRCGRWKVAIPKWRGDPHQLAETGEFRIVLDRCLSKLPTRMSHLFISRVTEDSDTSQLCEQLEITPENAWMLLHRARIRLRQCLTLNWFTPSAAKTRQSKPCVEH